MLIIKSNDLETYTSQENGLHMPTSLLESFSVT